MVLGLELFLILKTVKSFSYGVAVALLDETIQIFNGRGPEIIDVWIDALGLAIGIVLACVGQMIIRKAKRSVEHK